MCGRKSGGAKTAGAGVRKGERRWKRREAVEQRHKRRRKGRWRVQQRQKGRKQEDAEEAV